MASTEAAAKNPDDVSIAKNPNLDVAHWKFQIQTKSGNEAELKEKILAAIAADEMGPYYEALSQELGWAIDDALLSKLKAANEAKLQSIATALQDATENAGESEIRDAMLAKAEYLSKIGSKEAALVAFREVYEKAISTGQRLDISFHLIRIGFFFNDIQLIQINVTKSEELMEQGGDWDRRNRLKVYRGLFNLLKRDFNVAATLFFETVSTFTCTELMQYSTFVQYAVYLALISLSRPEIKKKAIDGPEVQEVLFDSPITKQYLLSLHECRYADFLKSLVQVEEEMKHDRFWSIHSHYYVKEMRIKAYAQLLESYRSLTLENMAAAFGISTGFLDKELSHFIAAGRLNCKIDKVRGVVETNRPDKKNAQYQAIIKQGDLLLNRIQKLSQVIDI